MRSNILMSDIVCIVSTKENPRKDDRECRTESHGCRKRHSEGETQQGRISGGDRNLDWKTG